MSNNVFEEIKKMSEQGQEFWSARELMIPLGYLRWESFETVISRAKKSCKNSNQLIQNHFRGITKMVGIGSGTKRQTNDYKFSRYACYPIAQNGDPRKPEIALAQTYFAIQTRKQGINELQIEDSKRVFLRKDTR